MEETVVFTENTCYTSIQKKLLNKDLLRVLEVNHMHTYISDNDGPYKIEFIKAYSGKCAYCGASIDIIPKTSFQIDHFIYEKDPRFKGSKAKAGYIENLVLACNVCNGAKNALTVPDEAHEYIHPDLPGIMDTFIRGDDFYIRISGEKKDNAIVNEFYKKLMLGSQVHRLDYLLLSMRGLREKLGVESSAYQQLSNAIELLHAKRNLMG